LAGVLPAVWAIYITIAVTITIAGITVAIPIAGAPFLYILITSALLGAGGGLDISCISGRESGRCSSGSSSRFRSRF
jgi:hypothetical protein